MRVFSKVLSLALAPLLTLGPGLAAAGAGEGPVANGSASAYAKAKGRMLDAYIAGRVTTAYALSRHLRAYRLGVDVQSGVVTLSGTVDNPVLRDLAVEMAHGIDEVQEVKSNIVVDPAAAPAESPSRNGFAGRFEDASITARVKTRLLLHASTGGLAINVDVHQQVVTLTGTVRSAEESALAEQITANTQGVRRVENRLTIDAARAKAA